MRAITSVCDESDDDPQGIKKDDSEETRHVEMAAQLPERQYGRLVDHWLDTECSGTDEDPKVGQTAFGGPSLGPSKGRGRRELAVDLKERRWHGPS